MFNRGNGDAETSSSTDIDAVAEEGVPTSTSKAHGPVRWPSERRAVRGRDQAGPSALAPRLGVHGVITTLIGDVIEECVVAPSSVQAAAGDSSSRSSPACGAKGLCEGRGKVPGETPASHAPDIEGRCVKTRRTQGEF